ncbi:DUF4214 domain-containing protein [Undibacterium baiyunense]|uniref:DUF4214 domain-containing protein n=1 Tax=Undibacterium baiyunense TaxID=2828731 RepID=A0A941DD06_9BURK|nr:DUF4214 domain-containing protein [Undibacterium baiyunense]MBR7745975.1 DUF4214 domain-containing protein [Undibacterium baiyunense]
MGLNASFVQKIYIAYFGRPADVAGLAYWEEQLDKKIISIEKLAESFSLQTEYQNIYRGKNSKEVLSDMYRNLFGREADVPGLNYWSKEVEIGNINIGLAALALVNGTTPGSTDEKTISNKLQYAIDFTQGLRSTPDITNLYKDPQAFIQVRENLKKINSDSASVTSTIPVLKAKIDIPAAVSGINWSEAQQPIKVNIDLTSLLVMPGYKIEVLKNNSPFSNAVTYTLTETDIKNKKLSIVIPANAGWGPDGIQTLAVQISDLAGQKGEIGIGTNVMIDTIVPNLPSKGFLTTSKALSGTSGGDYFVSNLKFDISPSSQNGNQAILKIGDRIVSSQNVVQNAATSLDFIFDYALGKQLYEAYSINKNLIFTIIDPAGNQQQINLSSGAIPLEQLSATITPPSNIKVIPIGGILQENAVNSTNINLKFSAEIDGASFSGGKATLKLSGREIASDLEILASDKTVDFDLRTTSNAALTAILQTGGDLSVSVINQNNIEISTTQSVVLRVDSSPPTPTAILTPPNNIQILPIGGTLVPNTLNSSNTGLKVSANITPGTAVGGVAALRIGNIVIDTDTTINASDNIVTFSIAGDSSSLLQKTIKAGGTITVSLSDINGKTVTSTNNPELHVKYDDLSSEPTSVSGKINAFELFAIRSVNSQFPSWDQLAVQLKAVVPPLPSNVASASLLLGGRSIATDTNVLKGDERLDFQFASVNKNQFGYAGFKIVFFDVNMKELASSPDLRSQWGESRYMVTHIGPPEASGVTLTAVGGNVVSNKFNASNTGIYAEATIAAQELIGGKVELRTTGGDKLLASVNITKDSGNLVKFDLANLGASGLKSAISSDTGFTIRVVDKDGSFSPTNSPIFNADYLPPNSAIKLNIVDSGQNKSLEASITAGQIQGGKAILTVNGINIASDLTIGANDGLVSFALSPNDSLNISNYISAGNAQISLYDLAGNLTSTNLQTLPVTVNANPDRDISPPSAAVSNALTIINNGQYTFEFGTKAILKFNEPTSKQINLTNLHIVPTGGTYISNPNFGVGATGIWNAAGDEFTITLGSSSTVMLGSSTIIVVGVQDLSGNSADVYFNR